MKLLIASNNAHKIREIKEILGDLFDEILSLREAGVPAPRTARFVSAVALARPGQPTRICRGTCEGTVGFAPRGNNGFGYDPYFTPLGMDKTFAELPAEVKNGMSHRAHALAALRRSLEEEG